MSDPIPTIESIVGMRPEPIKNEPTPQQLLDGGAKESWLKFLGIRPTAETHDVLVDIATQLRIANLQIERTYLQNELKGDHNNHPKLLRLMKVDGQIQNGLGLREPEL